MARAGTVPAIARRPVHRLLRGRLSGLGLARRSVGVDQPRPASQVRWVDETRRRNLHEVGIGHIQRPVGIGEFRRLSVEMDEVRIPADVFEIMPAQHAEDLPDSQTARCRRPHPANLVGPIGHADRRPGFRLVGGKVLKRNVACDKRRLFHRSDNVARDVARVEGACALRRNLPQCRRKLGILQQMARRERHARRIEEVRPCRGKPVQSAFLRPRDRFGETRGDRESLLGERDCRLEQFRPAGLAEPFVHRLE